MTLKRHNSIKLWFDRLLSKNLFKQFLVLGVVLILLLGLSYLLLSWSGADWETFCHKKDLNKWLLPVYLLIDSNALNNLYIGDTGQVNAVHGWMLIASSITFLFGAFIFNGIIISIIVNSLGRRIEMYKAGRLYYLKSGHYIIMGYDETVPSFITQIAKDEKAYILILTSAKTDIIREKLKKSFDKDVMDRIILNYGHRVSSECYNDIHLESAEHIFVIGNQQREAHDAINVECVDSIWQYLSKPEIKKRPGGITCVFKDLDTYAAFKTTDIFNKIKKLGVEFTPYNYYTGWAKQVFVKQKYRDFDNSGVEYDYPSVYGEGITPDDEKSVHLVFVGMTNFAVAFAMEAAHVLHFPNFSTKKARTRITFIDINADKEKDEFITRNRHFFDVQPYIYRDLTAETSIQLASWCSPFDYKSGYVRGEDYDFLDIEFEFIKGDIFSRNVQQEISKWVNGEKEYLSIFLTMANQRQNFVMGMNMPDAVYDNKIPVFILQNRSDNFVTDLREAKKDGPESELTYSQVNADGTLEIIKRDPRYANIYPFGMNETAYSADGRSLKRAKLINYLYENLQYGTYKFIAKSKLKAMPESEIWAEADRLWHKCSVALRWSNLYNAYTIRTKLACLRAMRGLKSNDVSRDYEELSTCEVEALARLEHNRWNVEKLLMGYRKAQKNEDKYQHAQYAEDLKTNKSLFIHHDIRPFDQLGDIKRLDNEFTRYIPWIMEMTEK